MCSPLDSEWDAATVAAHNELAAAYSAGDIDIPQPVDDNLWRLAKKVSRVSVRTVIHALGTEEFYDMPMPAKFHSTSTSTSTSTITVPEYKYFEGE